ncbi:MAG: hypothetical protein AAFQ68_14535 [Bacteroidota bacterium]
MPHILAISYPEGNRRISPIHVFCEAVIFVALPLRGTLFFSEMLRQAQHGYLGY